MGATGIETSSSGGPTSNLWLLRHTTFSLTSRTQVSQHAELFKLKLQQIPLPRVLAVICWSQSCSPTLWTHGARNRHTRSVADRSVARLKGLRCCRRKIVVPAEGNREKSSGYELLWKTFPLCTAHTPLNPKRRLQLTSGNRGNEACLWFVPYRKE